MIVIESFLRSMKAKPHSSDQRPDRLVISSILVDTLVNGKTPKCYPPQGIPFPQPRVPRTLFEQQAELEEHLMKNPLTRGKGVKSIKIVKALLGVSDIVAHLRPSRPRFLCSPDRSFPSWGLGHLLSERYPRWNIKYRFSGLRLSENIQKKGLLPLSEILAILLSCLCVGCYVFLGSLIYPNEVSLSDLLNKAIGVITRAIDTLSGSQLVDGSLNTATDGHARDPVISRQIAEPSAVRDSFIQIRSGCGPLK